MPWVVTGPSDAPALVLVAPLGATLETWDEVVPLLARERRVIRFDLRGHGRSPATPQPAAIADLGRDILDVMDDARVERAAVCGVSIGGMGAMWAAAHQPGRVEALILCCTSAKLGPAGAWRSRAALVRSSGMTAVATAVAGRWVTDRWKAEHPDHFARLRAMVESVRPEAYAGWCDAIATMDLRGELASIAAPTVVIGGDEDTAVPLSDLNAIAAGVDGARIVVIPSAAHHPPIEQPRAVGALIREHLRDQEETAHAS